MLPMMPNPAATAGTGTNTRSEESFNWHAVMEAIIEVESKGNADAKNGTQIGAMQIKPILVQDCNRILAERQQKHRYTLQDRYNVEKSKEMFCLIQSYYNPQNNVEKAIRSWNGGPNYSVKATQGYYEKVKKVMGK